jgi:hypothetical protein
MIDRIYHSLFTIHYSPARSIHHLPAVQEPIMHRYLQMLAAIIGSALTLLLLATEATAIAPPANDNFANAQAISFGVGQVTGTNVDATKQTGEPAHAGNAGGKSVWFKWTSVANYATTFDTEIGGLSDTLVAVYQGSSVNALTLIASNDDYGNVDGSPHKSRLFFPATTGAVYYIAVDGYSGASGSFTLRWNINRRPSRGTDLDGNGQDDITVFRPSNGTWYSLLSQSNSIVATQFGISSDIPVPADYDGDGKTDIAVFRPSTGYWYILLSFSNSVRSEKWGVNGDIPTPGDFNLDGRADFAFFRPSNGTWYISDSYFSIYASVNFGQNGDKPVLNDYDGDGRVDPAVRRPSNNSWYILRSSDGAVVAVQWGIAGDIPVPGDYKTIDGKADIAVFRPSNGTWYVLDSYFNSSVTTTWGQSGDIPQPMNTVTNTPATGASDYVVFRPSNNTWYILDSTNQSTKTVTWGASGDKPASSGFVIQQ